MKKFVLSGNFLEKTWMFFGAILVFAVSMPGQALLGRLFSLHNFHMVSCLPGFPFFMTGILFSSFNSVFARIFFTPIIVPSILVFSFSPLVFFIYGSLKISKKSFLMFLFILTTVIMILDVYCFYTGWDYGIRYQGIKFLYHSVIKNIILFLMIYLFVWLYYIKRYRIFLHIALLIFCVTISIIAFPWLGESI